MCSLYTQVKEVFKASPFLVGDDCVSIMNGTDEGRASGSPWREAMQGAGCVRAALLVPCGSAVLLRGPGSRDSPIWVTVPAWEDLRGWRERRSPIRSRSKPGTGSFWRQVIFSVLRTFRENPQLLVCSERCCCVVDSKRETLTVPHQPPTLNMTLRVCTKGGETSWFSEESVDDREQGER